MLQSSLIPIHLHQPRLAALDVEARSSTPMCLTSLRHVKCALQHSARPCARHLCNRLMCSAAISTPMCSAAFGTSMCSASMHHAHVLCSHNLVSTPMCSVALCTPMSAAISTPMCSAAISTPMCFGSNQYVHVLEFSKHTHVLQSVVLLCIQHRSHSHVLSIVRTLEY